jgi:hypothetical protein
MTILQVLAHAPATRYELSFLVGMTPDEVADAIWDQLVPSRLAEVDEHNIWSITDLGRETLRLIAAFEAGQRRDAACQGVRS